MTTDAARRPGAFAPSPAFRPDALTALALALGALVLLAPLPLGSVHQGAVFLLAAWAALIGWLCLALRHEASFPFGRGALAVPALLAGIVLLQTVPLPGWAARVLSPSSVALRGGIPWTEAAAWYPASVHPEATLAAAARLGEYAVIFFAAAALAAHRRSHRHLLAAVFAAGIFQAAYGMVEYLRGSQWILWTVPRSFTDVATGTYVNRNHYAGALELPLFLGLGFFLARRTPAGAPAPARGWRARLAHSLERPGGPTVALGMLTAIVAMGLVLSFSRSGIAASAVTAGALLALGESRKGKRARAAVLGVSWAAVALFSVLILWTRPAVLSGPPSGPGSAESRLLVWRDSLRIVRDYPVLGTGLGTFEDIYPAYQDGRLQMIFDHAHNDYLQALVEGGFLGAAAAVFLAALFFAGVARRFRRSDEPGDPLLAGAAAGLVCLLLHEFTDFNLRIPANALMFFTVAGALWGGLRSTTEEPRTGRLHIAVPGRGEVPPRRGRASRLAFLLIVALATCGAGFAWADLCGNLLMAQYREAAPRELGADDPASRAARIRILERAASWRSVTAEARTAIALEVLARAVGTAAGGTAPEGERWELERDLRRAAGEVSSALVQAPTDTRAWMAGYQVVSSSRLIGKLDGLQGLPGGTPVPGGLESAFLRGIIQTHPNGGAAATSLALVMLSVGDRQGAFEQFRRAASMPNANLLRIASSLLDAGFPPDDIAEILPASFPEQYDLGLLLRDRGWPEQAEKTLLRAAGYAPTRVPAWLSLCHLAESQGRHNEALGYAAKPEPDLADADPAIRADIHYCAALAARSLSWTVEALQYARRALEENPRLSAARLLSGSLLLESGDSAGAVREWRSLLDTEIQDPYVAERKGLLHRLTGQALEQLGLREQAVEQYLDALQASPEDQPSREALARLSGRRAGGVEAGGSGGARPSPR